HYSPRGHGFWREPGATARAGGVSAQESPAARAAQATLPTRDRDSDTAESRAAETREATDRRSAFQLALAPNPIAAKHHGGQALPGCSWSDLRRYPWMLIC